MPSSFIQTMFARLTALLLLFGNCSFAQVDGFRSPTKFDRFIDLKKVQWAAYTNHTISFDKYNLSNELYKRFQKDEIKISEPLSRDSLMAGFRIIYLDKKDLELRSFAPGSDINSTPTNKVDSNSSSVINVQEILYVSDGKLYSYIPWASPLISIYTSRGRFIGTSEYFSSCINYKYNFKSSKRDRLVFITSTKRKIIIDSIPRTDMLKELYGINMLEAIWKDVVNGKNGIINASSGQKMSFKNLQLYDFTSTVQVPVYDSTGNIIAYRTAGLPLTASQFNQVEITQNWFYNYTKNIVVNSIPDITLFVRKNDGDLMPYIKIIFNN